MKMNMNNVFDDFDLKNTEQIAKKNITAEYDGDMAKRVKANTLSKINADNKQSRKSVRKKVFSFKRMIAVAAALIIVFSTLSVGATVYFKPDSALAEYFTFNDDVDLSTLGQDVNITETSGGYEITLKQVLSDNSTFHFVFECPQEDGKLLVPSMVDLLINGKYYPDGFGAQTYISGDNTCSIIISGLRNIKNNDRITIEVNWAAYYDNKTKQFSADDDDVEGKWNFTFNALRANVKTKLEPLSTIKASDSEYKIERFTVSPLGIHMDYKQINGTSSDVKSGIEGDHTELTSNGKPFAVVEMKDGTVYTDNVDNNCFDMTIGGTAIAGLPYTGNVDITFKNVVNVDDIKTITIDGSMIYNAQ